MNTFCFGLLLTLGGFFCSEPPQKAKKPLVVFVCGDHEYSGEETLPIVAAELEKNYGMRTIVLKSSPITIAKKISPGWKR